MALTVATALTACRVLFVAVAGFAGRTSNEAAAAVVLAVFSVPFVVPLLRRLGGARAATVTVVALAGWRAAVLADQRIPFAVAVAGAVLALLAATFVLAAERSPEALLAGVLGGMVVDVLVRSAFATLDPVWQRTAPATVLGLALAASLAVAAIRGGRAVPRGTVPPAGRSVWTVGTGLAFGGAMGLEVLFLLSPGFVASSAGVTLPAAVILVLLGLAAAAAVIELGSGRGGLLVAAGVLVGCGAVLPVAEGAGVLLLVAAGQVAAVVVLAHAVPRGGNAAAVRSTGGLAVGWLALAVGVLLYQLHFDQPLPVDNRWVTALMGALTASAAFGRRHAPSRGAPSRTPVRTAWVGALALVGAAVVPFSLTLTDRTAVVAEAPTTLRVVEWNVRQGVTDDGQLDPEGIARLLERTGQPDVVVLVEAARGWPMSGDFDLVAWLSRRLGLPYVWGGAADGQFGNVVLARLPVMAQQVVDLPVAGDAQGRSLVRAELELGGGDRLTVLATHLQHRNDERSMAARMAEIAEVLQVWGGAPRTLLLGDLNPRQGDPPDHPPRVPGEFEEIQAILDAGFTTTQDLSSCSAPTSNRNCSDYVFVTPDLVQGPVEVVPFDLADHLPLVTTIRLR